MDITNRIKELQEERNWSVNHLAIESGISAATIFGWYNKNSTPTLKALTKICEAFGMTVAEFFNESIFPIELTVEEKELLNEWKLLRPIEKEIFLALLKTINERVNLQYK